MALLMKNTVIFSPRLAACRISAEPIAAYDGLIDVSAELGLPAGIERGVTVIREESSSLIGAPS